MNCSINNKKGKSKSCFNNEEIIEIAKAYNKDKAFHNHINLSYPNSIESIYKSLQDTLGKDEHSWIEKKFIHKVNKKLYKKITKYTFKPKGPKNVDDWLSTIHIDNIMNQVALLYNNFLYLGAVPSDFSKLSKLDMKKYKKYDYIGIIFNKDNHTQKGSHWVSCFINNKEESVVYIDSLGKKPNKNIYHFINHFAYKLKINKIQHQKDDINCGVFSMYFIMLQLKVSERKEKLDLFKKVVSEKSMRLLRKKLYLHH